MKPTTDEYLKESREIWLKFTSDKERYEKEIEKTSKLYNLLELLRKFSNIVNEEVMEEFFPGNGRHMWDKFVRRYNRDMIAWYNSLDSDNIAVGSREAFVIHLLFGEGVHVERIKK